MPETRVNVRPVIDFCAGLKSATLVIEISTASRAREGGLKRQLWAPGTGGAPGPTALPRTAPASAAVRSEQASRFFGALSVGALVAPCAVCVGPVDVPLAGTPLVWGRSVAAELPHPATSVATKASAINVLQIGRASCRER